MYLVGIWIYFGFQLLILAGKLNFLVVNFCPRNPVQTSDLLEENSAMTQAHHCIPYEMGHAKSHSMFYARGFAGE